MSLGIKIKSGVKGNHFYHRKCTLCEELGYLSESGHKRNKHAISDNSKKTNQGIKLAGNILDTSLDKIVHGMISKWIAFQHCVKSARIRSIRRYGVSLRIQS